MKADGQGTDEALHEQLTRKREDDDIEGHKGKVGPTFAIVSRSGGVETDGEWDQGISGWQRIGEKNGFMKRIACCRINEVAGKHDNYDNEWVDPSVTKGEVLPTTEQTMCFSTFGVRTGDPGLRIALRRD